MLATRPFPNLGTILTVKTIKISDDIHQQLKVTAAQMGIEMQALVEIYLATMLDGRGRIVFATARKDWRRFKTTSGPSETPVPQTDANLAS